MDQQINKAPSRTASAAQLATGLGDTAGDTGVTSASRAVTGSNDGKILLLNQEMLRNWKTAKSAFLNAGLDLAKYGSFWTSTSPQVGVLAQKHAEAALDLQIETLRMMDLDGPGLLRLLPIEVPALSDNDSYVHAQAYQQNMEQLQYQRAAIDTLLDILTREAELLREKYAPTLEAVQEL